MNNTVPKSVKPKAMPRGGSRKGIPNKVTSDVKAMILEALDGAGGASYLQRQADENPNAFMTLIGKVLPMQVSNPDGSNLFSGIKVSFVRPDQG